MNTTIDTDLEALSKKLYLESPDLWIEFLDKTGERIIDEMVLFFAIKYNAPSIVKFAIDNNKLNLDKPSKNNAYTSIRGHLLATAKQYNCVEALELLSNNLDVTTDITKDSNNISKHEDINKNQSNDMPHIICQNCKCNILDLGYRILGDTVHKFSSSENKLIEVQSSQPHKIVCSNCNHISNDITLDKIESICSIQSCNACGMNLTIVGILDTSKLEYDNESNSFISKSTNCLCGNCKNPISQNQKINFNL